MKHTITGLTLGAIIAGLAPGIACADATALAYVGDERTALPTPPANTGASQASMSVGSPLSGQYAYALSDQIGGILRLAGNSGAAYPYITTSDASASFSEVVSFSGGFGQTAYLDYSFDGTLGVNAPAVAPSAAYAQMLTYVANVGGAFTQYETLSAYAGNCGSGTNCVVGTSTARTGSLAFTIYDGPNTVTAQMHAFASYGNTFDFANTAKFYLRTPDGVTFSAANGFLSQASPISPVPEPSSYVLLVAGFGLVAFLKIRGRHNFRSETITF